MHVKSTSIVEYKLYNYKVNIYFEPTNNGNNELFFLDIPQCLCNACHC